MASSVVVGETGSRSHFDAYTGPGADRKGIPADEAAHQSPEAFIRYWSDKGGSERANYQKFINQLCALIGTAEPEASSEQDALNNYVYEKRVRALDLEGDDGRNNYLDCYKRDCFVLEAKQSRKRQRGGQEGGDLFGGLPHSPPPAGTRPSWDRLMRQARAQAERYAKALPTDHGWPPFLIVVDVGHVIETYADFTGLGKAYMPFPDSRSHRIRLADLADPEIRARLKAIWEAPKSLDPSARRAEVTRDIAQRLARLAQSLEKRYEPKQVALFLMRCLFTAFAQNVGLLPDGAFTGVLNDARPNPQFLPRYLEPFWRSMDTGSDHDTTIRARVRHFNGGLFREAEALALDEQEIGELIAACSRDWKNVEPAIFGTLLENALSKRERSQYGAFFTPRAYVERLVVPAVIEPLMAEWRNAQVIAETARQKNDHAQAIKQIKDFHQKLCSVKILDPACGSGNFLYVALEKMKALEGEVIATLEEIGGGTQANLDLAGHTVGPHQLLGLEKNPRAVPIAELVIWIGHLQCHLRQRGPESLSEPILHSYDNIRQCDAVLTWDRVEPMLDEAGQPRVKWDGVSWKTDPFTGQEVPDESRTVPLQRHIGAKPADWPQADYIVGNPPFIAGKDLRAELGDGYAEALRKAYPQMPGGADFVTYWWDKAAELVRKGAAKRFGFITTNSITQTFSRRVIQRHLDANTPLYLTFAVPDHPWADGQGAAAVRVAMTVGALVEHDERTGLLKTVVREGTSPDNDGAVSVELKPFTGIVRSDLTVGADIASAKPLASNGKISSRGVSLHGAGFLVTPAQARALGLGRIAGLEERIREYRNGRDLTGRSRALMVIDLFGMTEAEVRQKYPDVYQWLLDRVKPERDSNSRQSYRENWWIFGEPRKEMRRALCGQFRYISTVETAKHRLFQFLEKIILPDNMLVNIAIGEEYALGVLSSKIHVKWSLAAGGWLGVGNDPRYNKTRCFDTFPFPNATPHQKRVIGRLAEELDAHRKRVLAEHPDQLTLTELYNVLEKGRSREELTAREMEIYQLGQVGVMLDLHSRIDHAVADAYGWPADLEDARILENLVALNAERHREERDGLVRWLRPDYQNPKGQGAAVQIAATLDIAADTAKRIVWPKAPTEQVHSLMAALNRCGRAVEAESLARQFKGARSPRVKELLDILVSVGHARQINNLYAP
ncbi:class I SAM-dependent DNA methyltransferase [Azospirillum sp. TSO5]|uniref:class I SAM-dependent DNA methyltransferase n=1 Tax=Azospirillum sp. TSO5 TaxID=716760 RepID=UPI0018EE6B74|nr:class I SAM-dependent DNA methyltransferase [Azospirillum sp. TSO5]